MKGGIGNNKKLTKLGMIFCITSNMTHNIKLIFKGPSRKEKKGHPINVMKGLVYSLTRKNRQMAIKVA